MAKTKQIKQETLTLLTKKLQRMKTLIFTHYQGLSVKDVTALRRLLREQEVDLLVTKKTLLRQALATAKVDPGIVDRLTGDVALAFGFADQVTPARVLQTFAKTHQAVKLMGGIVDGQYLDAAQAVALARLPSREELLSMTVRVIQGQLTGLVQVLSGNVRGLINVLQAYKDNKPAEAGT